MSFCNDLLAVVARSSLLKSTSALLYTALHIHGRETSRCRPAATAPGLLEQRGSDNRAWLVGLQTALGLRTAMSCVLL